MLAPSDVIALSMESVGLGDAPGWASDPTLRGQQWNKRRVNHSSGHYVCSLPLPAMNDQSQVSSNEGTGAKRELFSTRLSSSIICQLAAVH